MVLYHSGDGSSQGVSDGIDWVPFKTGARCRQPGPFISLTLFNTAFPQLYVNIDTCIAQNIKASSAGLLSEMSSGFIVGFKVTVGPKLAPSAGAAYVILKL
jgi:hypothetical protein